MNLADLLPQLNDRELNTLAYICGQAEGRQADEGLSLPRGADAMSTLVQVEVAARRRAARAELVAS